MENYAAFKSVANDLKLNIAAIEDRADTHSKHLIHLNDWVSVQS